CPQRAASGTAAPSNRNRWSVPRIFLPLALFLLIAVARTHAVEPPAQTLRYLFLVEISPAMATRQIPSAQTIHDIILRSFEGEIKPGQLYALWFYGANLQSNPPIVWRPGHEAAMARYTANLFRDRVFSRLGRRDTLADAARAIATSPKLTIFLFTDGSHSIRGTPFDAAINSEMQKSRSLFQKAEKPFVITFMAAQGKLIDATVNTDPTQAFRIPERDRQDNTIAKASQPGRNAPEPKPAAATDIDKALAAVRNAPPSAPQSDTEKARAALRDALEGKTNSAPAEKLTMQVAPALREPPKEQEPAKELPPTEQPKPQPTPQPTPEKPKEVPSLLIRPPETTAQVVPPSGGPSVASNPPPQTETAREEKNVATKPTEVAPQPRPIEKAPEPKPIITPPVETPKPAVVEAPKTVAVQPKPAVAEPKSAVIETKSAISEPKARVPDPKPAVTEPKKMAMATPPPAAEKKSQSNTTVVAKPSPPSTPPIQTATVTPSSRFPWPALIGGLAVIAFGGALAVIRAKRRAKSPGSIITQALPKNGPRFK
ncbi:MAG TPA: hypothetical protein VM680_07340, partial [Verrucomicrobiae bacterium]|nr:hypothetical protein [Verrucomicrobiae bacterium]